MAVQSGHQLIAILSRDAPCEGQYALAFLRQMLPPWRCKLAWLCLHYWTFWQHEIALGPMIRQIVIFPTEHLQEQIELCFLNGRNLYIYPIIHISFSTVFELFSAAFRSLFGHLGAVFRPFSIRFGSFENISATIRLVICMYGPMVSGPPNRDTNPNTATVGDITCRRSVIT